MLYKLRIAIASAAFLFFAVPALASAASLSSAQAGAIIGLLQAFGADQSVILQVEQYITGTPTATTTPADPPPPHVPVTGSVYRSSNLGFDFSYNTPIYPQNAFSFGIVGVTHGKAFTQNQLLAQEYSWAKFGAGAPPTVYVNINGPYGSMAVGSNISGPQTCPPATNTGSTTEPTACEGYNYGYNSAQNAYAYAKTNSVTSPIWWLDIEEANSWSDDTSVNDATIQGAIDYLNSQNVRVGVYSVANMWSDIAGAEFTPTQTINGQAVSIPSWIPIGTQTQVSAINSCGTMTSFIPGSPVWLVQYEANSTAVDQNLSC
jgi:hypothetical protein